MYLDVDFGKDYAGLSTVGYTLLDNTGTIIVARTTSGVFEIGKGKYGVEASVPTAFIGTVYWDTANGSEVTALESIDLTLAHAGDRMALLLSYDLYSADIQFTNDELNPEDEFTITWFKNGVRLTTGITSPTIRIVRRSNGTDLVATTAMTEIGSTGSFKYDEAANRIADEEAALIIIEAVIDGNTRTFSRIVTKG